MTAAPPRSSIGRPRRICRFDGLGIEVRKLPAQDLERILALHLRYVQGQRGGVRASFKFFDLSNTSLAKRNLAGADLTGANMTGVDLSGADLRAACLFGADLRKANLA